MARAAWTGVAGVVALALCTLGARRDARGSHDVQDDDKAGEQGLYRRTRTLRAGKWFRGAVQGFGPGAGALVPIAASNPCSSAVGVGGHPGISTFTGITFATRPRLA